MKPNTRPKPPKFYFDQKRDQLIAKEKIKVMLASEMDRAYEDSKILGYELFMAELNIPIHCKGDFR